MMELNIYYIKDVQGKVVYTHTNSVEFATYVDDYMKLGLGKYPTYQAIKNAVPDLEIGYKTITVDFDGNE